MSQATYKFDLSDPDDAKEFQLMGKAKDMALSLLALDESLRHEVKYQDHPAGIADVYQRARDMLHEKLAENDIDLDNLLP